MGAAFNSECRDASILLPVQAGLSVPLRHVLDVPLGVVLAAPLHLDALRYRRHQDRECMGASPLQQWTVEGVHLQGSEWPAPLHPIRDHLPAQAVVQSYEAGAWAEHALDDRPRQL